MRERSSDFSAVKMSAHTGEKEHAELTSEAAFFFVDFWVSLLVPGEGNINQLLINIMTYTSS